MWGDITSGQNGENRVVAKGRLRTNEKRKKVGNKRENKRGALTMESSWFRQKRREEQRSKCGD